MASDALIFRDTTDHAAELIKLLEAGKLEWRWWLAPETRHLAKWIAIRESDKSKIKGYMEWDPDKKGRKLKIDPLPERIPTAFADFLYGEDPMVEPNDENDAELLDAIVEGNDLPTTWHDAVETSVSEGEVWWRIYRDEVQSDVPIIEWHSRTEVVPLWRGRRLLACAFIVDLGKRDGKVWRRCEVYAEGIVRNYLYVEVEATPEEERIRDRLREADPTTAVGSEKIGDRQPLTAHPETQGLEEEWDHGLPMLAGRIVHKRGRRYQLGRSIYHGIEDLIFDLNEAHTIDAENFRLAGKKRAVLPEKYAQRDSKGNQGFDAAEEVLFAEEVDEMNPDNTFMVLQYTYDGESSIARKRDLEGTMLTRVGLARQLTDPNTPEGWSASGTALRTRLIPTTTAARGVARPWDGDGPRILMLAQRVDALDEGSNGFGRDWNAPEELPSIERGSILPEDPQEEATRHVALVAGQLESTETAIKELHPDWDDDAVAAEVARIKQGTALSISWGDTGNEDTGGEPPA